MRKALGISIMIGRFGSEPVDVTVPKNSTIEDALKVEGISLSAGEKVWVGGEKASMADVLEKGDIINIVGSKEGGR